MTAKAKTRSSKLNVLTKADEILELLAEAGDLTIAQLAERSGEPRTSLYRLVATLEDLEFVTPGRQPGTYQLGMQLYRFGSLVSARSRIRQASLGAVKQVFERTGETVFLLLRHRDCAVCIERIDGRRVKSMAVEIGGSLPLHLGAAPLVLLAHAGPDQVDQLLARPLEHPTEQSVTDPVVIRQRLEEIRQRGYAVSDGDLVSGIAALGAPIHGPSGEVVASMSISGARPSILGDSFDDNVALLVEAASAVNLGAPDDPQRSVD